MHIPCKSQENSKERIECVSLKCWEQAAGKKKSCKKQDKIETKNAKRKFLMLESKVEPSLQVTHTQTHTTFFLF